MRCGLLFRSLGVFFATVLVLGTTIGRGGRPEIRVLGSPLPGEQQQIRRLVSSRQWWEAKVGARLLANPKNWCRSFSWLPSEGVEGCRRLRGILGRTRKITIAD